MARTRLSVNGMTVSVTVDDPDMPLLYVLRDELGLRGPRFGCGLGQCGACTVHIDGVPCVRASRRCPRSATQGRDPRGARHGRASAPAAAGLHRGAGGAMRLLHQRHDHAVRRIPGTQPETHARSRSGRRWRSNLCRCGTHLRIVRAVMRAAGRPEGDQPMNASRSVAPRVLKGPAL